MKNIQIPEELFFNIIRYITAETNEEMSKELRNMVIDGLTEKLQKIIDRELYTTYKTAPTEEEREKARQKYLDSKGIPENFRW